MDNIRLYIKESIDELMNNVTWPTWNELAFSARIVLIATVIFALITFMFDGMTNTVLKAIYGLTF